MDVLSRRGCFEGTSTCVRSRDLVTCIEQGRPVRGRCQSPKEDNVHRNLRDVFKWRTCAVKYARDFCRREVKRPIELLFGQGQHPFHPCGRTVTALVLFNVREDIPDELAVMEAV